MKIKEFLLAGFILLSSSNFAFSEDNLEEYLSTPLTLSSAVNYSDSDPCLEAPPLLRLSRDLPGLIGITGSRCGGISDNQICSVEMKIALGKQKKNYRIYKLGETNSSIFSFYTPFIGQPIDKAGKNKGVNISLGFKCNNPDNSQSKKVLVPFMRSASPEASPQSSQIYSKSVYLPAAAFSGKKVAFFNWAKKFASQISINSNNLFLSDNQENSSSTNNYITPAEGKGIWKPQPQSTWQWQLTGDIDYSVSADVFDIDPFSKESGFEAVRQLKSMGKKVICYFSAGTYEDWRQDAKFFHDSIKGNDVGGAAGGGNWEGERWLDIRQMSLIVPIMTGRMHLMKQWGCDAVEPDNVDAYDNDSGFPITKEHQIAYLKVLVDAAHKINLSIGLKNALDLVDDVVGNFDFAINEQCFQYSECNKLDSFIAQGKAVFGVEYEISTGQFCGKANAKGFSWLRKNYDLDAWRQSCL